MSEPTLTVYMANYNQSRYLKYSVNAVLEQSYQPMEFIILDDCSTDDSLEVLESFADENPIIKIVRNKKNRGAVQTVNKLLRMSKGDYIYGAAADDLILPGFLEKTMSMLKKYPDAALCSTLSTLIGRNGENLGLYPTPIVSTKPEYFSPGQSLLLLKKYGSWIMGNTAAFHRESLLQVGGFDEDLGSFNDGFIHMVLALRHGACYIPEPLAGWRRLDDGIAAATKAELSAWFDNKRKAAIFMKTDYAELFPPEFADYFERQQLFRAIISAKGDRGKKTYLKKSIDEIYDGSVIAKLGWQFFLNLTGYARELFEFISKFLSFQFTKLKGALRLW